MLRSLTIIVLASCTWLSANAQQDSIHVELPFDTIRQYPDTLTAATLLARSIEGLGFRFYWASEGLTENDYTYSSGNGNRTTREILEHILGLSEMISNVVLGVPNIRPKSNTKKSDFVRRKMILNNLKQAVDFLRDNPNLDLLLRPIIFQRGDNISEMPNWHLYNGPLADAVWHCGQLVTNRRASGNPIADGVNVFMGSKE